MEIMRHWRWLQCCPWAIWRQLFKFQFFSFHFSVSCWTVWESLHLSIGSTGMNTPLKVHDYDFSLKFLVSFDCHRARTHICSSIQIPKLLLMKNLISSFGSLVTMLIPIYVNGPEYLLRILWRIAMMFILSFHSKGMLWTAKFFFLGSIL